MAGWSCRREGVLQKESLSRHVEACWTALNGREWEAGNSAGTKAGRTSHQCIVKINLAAGQGWNGQGDSGNMQSGRELQTWTREEGKRLVLLKKYYRRSNRMWSEVRFKEQGKEGVDVLGSLTWAAGWMVVGRSTWVPVGYVALEVWAGERGAGQRGEGHVSPECE